MFAAISCGLMGAIGSYYSLPLPMYAAVCAIVAILISVHARRATFGIFVAMLTVNPQNTHAPIPYGVVCAYVVALLFFSEVRARLASRYIITGGILLVSGFVFSMSNWTARSLNPSQLSAAVTYVGLIWVPLAVFAATYRDARAVTLTMQYLVLATTAILAVVAIFGTEGVTYDDEYGTVSSIMSFGNVSYVFTRTQICPVLGALAVASLAFAVSMRSAFSIACFIGCMAVDLYLLLYQASVGSVAATTVAAAAVLVVAARSRTGKVLTRLCGIAAIIFAVFAYQGTGLLGVLERSGARVAGHAETATTTGGDRYAVWANAARAFVEQPLGTGWAVDGLTTITGDGLGPHNDYLLYGLMYGVCGAIGYMFAIGGALFMCVKSALSRAPSDEAAASLAGFGVAVVVGLNSFTDYLVANRWYFSTMWVLMCLGMTPCLGFGRWRSRRRNAWRFVDLALSSANPDRKPGVGRVLPRRTRPT